MSFLDRSEYWTAKGDAARAARSWDNAARCYRKALKHNPDSAPIWVQYGHALKESGRMAEAESAYLRSLAISPYVADTYLQLGHPQTSARARAMERHSRDIVASIDAGSDCSGRSCFKFSRARASSSAYLREALFAIMAPNAEQASIGKRLSPW